MGWRGEVLLDKVKGWVSEVLVDGVRAWVSKGVVGVGRVPDSSLTVSLTIIGSLIPASYPRLCGGLHLYDNVFVSLKNV